MPNFIKYSTLAQTLALKKGNFWIGTGDVGKGPTSTTDYWAGIAPPSGGYTIYLNKAQQGPSIYRPTSDAELISLTNSLSGESFTTAAQCLDYFVGQSDKMCFNRDYEAITTNGLILNIDGGFTPSYPTTGTSWYDISSNSKTVTLTNGPSFNSNSGGGIVFDGADDYGNLGTIGGYTNKFSCESWFKTTSSASWKNIICGGCGDIIFTINGNYVNFGSQCSSPIPHLNYSTTAVNSGAWFFASVTYDSGVAKVYVNGTLENTYTRSDASQTPGTVFVGSNATGTSEFFNGTIAVVRMYDRALSAAEIIQNFNAQKTRFGF
jgi:hypothetical protein